MEWNACKEGIEWFKNKNIKQIDYEELIKELIAENQYKWCFWLIISLLNKSTLNLFTKYCFNSVTTIFELLYPWYSYKYPDHETAINIAKESGFLPPDGIKAADMTLDAIDTVFIADATSIITNDISHIIDAAMNSAYALVKIIEANFRSKDRIKEAINHGIFLIKYQPKEN
jgi:hypothetical protein